MRFWCVAFVILIAMPAGAQVRSSRARPDSSNAPPRFPDMMRAAHVGGTVRASIVVDTAGRVVPESFKVLHADHDLFVSSLRSAVTRWRFLAKRRYGRALPDTIEQEVTFVVPSDPAVTLAEPVVLVRTAVAPGHYRLVIGWPGADPAPVRLDSATTSEIALATFDTLLASLVPSDTSSPTRIVCVGVSDSVNAGQPDAPAMKRLARARLAVVVARRCPPTFASMVAIVYPNGETNGGPPGEDPWSVAILHVRPYAADVALVNAVIRHGTGATYYRCRTDRDTATPETWRATCEISHVVLSQAQSVRSRTFADVRGK